MPHFPSLLAPLLAGTLALGCESSPATVFASPDFGQGSGGGMPSAPPSHPEGNGRKRSTPFAGTWYLTRSDATSSLRLTLELAWDAGTSSYAGSIVDEAGVTSAVDEVTVASDDATIAFRRNGEALTEWYRASVVDGVLVGRVAAGAAGSREPASLVAYGAHVTGWSRRAFDSEIVPRSFEVVLQGALRATVRLDRDAERGALVGTMKVTSSVTTYSWAEEPELDLSVRAWDGHALAFDAYGASSVRRFDGTVDGRSVVGTYQEGPAVTPGAAIDPATLGAPAAWSGARSEVLGFGIGGRQQGDAAHWRGRTARRLEHLIMGDDPKPLSRQLTYLKRGQSPRPMLVSLADRDDDALAWPQAYSVDEVQFDWTLPNPYGETPLARTAHGFIATPTTPPPDGGFPVVLAVNGHAGSAYQMLDPGSEYFWYGDAYARRGYVVLLVDISHRPLADRRGLYADYVDGDDPFAGNGTHPSIKADGMDSDWEEDGERAWDAMHAFDFALELPNVNANEALVTGLSMGGEVTTLVGALDARFALTIPAGFSPDLGVVRYNGNHPCWEWLNADVEEYLGVSDYHALTAPRPIIVETGRIDDTFSRLAAPFAGDKQVARRSRQAFVAAPNAFLHYLHYDRHHYHVGDLGLVTLPERDVRLPLAIAPATPWAVDWQTDGSTVASPGSLFDHIDSILR